MERIFVLNIILIFVLVNISFSYSHVSKSSKNDNKVLTTGYYVVIGAYSKNKENYASRYAQIVNEKGRSAEYGFSRKKDLYFVYLHFTGNYRESLTAMQEARSKKEFSEAWVFVCLDPGPIQMEQLSEAVGTQQSVMPETQENSHQKRLRALESIKQPEEVKESIPSPEKDVSIERIITKEEANFNVETLDDASVFLNLFNGQNRKDVFGEVQVVDTERAKLIDVIKGGEYVDLRDPKNGTGKVTLLCDVFGYRRMQKEINYYKPTAHLDDPDVEILADVYLVNFELTRYHVGDIVTMYNVYFFKDAALMRPESKYEVNSLLEMLKENPNYRIRIHGHVNGKHPGKIISQGDSKEFFALDDLNKEGFGSAKELSRQRGELIMNYLIGNGIEESRMEVKAWGGKRMLYDKHSSRAKQNVRVEIEILDE